LVKEVLKRLQFNDLYAKAEKYFFEQSSIKYLGVIILKNKVQMDEEKCYDLANWLSHYLYLFSFLIYNYKIEHGKVSHDFVTMSPWCDRWSWMVMSHVT